LEKHPHTIAQLFQKFIQNRCTAEELDRLYRYFDTDEDEDVLKEIILAELEREIEPEEVAKQQPHLSDLFDQISEKVLVEPNRPSLYRKMLAGRWARVAALFVIAGFASFMSYLYIHNRPATDKVVQSDMVYPQPGTEKAVLTLFNGKEVVLNDANEGQLIQESGITVSNNPEGLVTYQIDPSVAIVQKALTHINTIRTPRGGQYQIILADGTKVWLNASSSLDFPSHFSGDSRKVKLSGEAYFEVAHDTMKPFFVQTAESEVEVLGTSFNVMAYPDEQHSQITLLTGAVKVNRDEETIRLLPGQQAEIKRNSDVVHIHTVNTEAIVAWKNGIFLFDQSELSQAMRQVGRWYNADIEYMDKVPAVKLTGMVSRKDSLSVLLDILEHAGGLEIDVQGNKIMVKQSK